MTEKMSIFIKCYAAIYPEYFQFLRMKSRSFQSLSEAHKIQHSTVLTVLYIGVFFIYCTCKNILILFLIHLEMKNKSIRTETKCAVN
jgi:hypothetical protein